MVARELTAIIEKLIAQNGWAEVRRGLFAIITFYDRKFKKKAE